MKTVCHPCDLRERKARTRTKAGYIIVRCPEHPAAGASGQVYYHRLVMERRLGRFLRAGEVVHHRNGDRADNRLSNLEVMSPADHHKHHHQVGQLRSASRSKEDSVVGLRSRGLLVEQIAQRVGLCEPTVLAILRKYPIVCGYCGRTFQRQKGLGMHITRAHRR